MKEDKKSNIIGFVRYSQRINFGDAIRDIFEETYFEYRYKIFTEITLKSFQEQTHKDFKLLILHSVTMPEAYKIRFAELEDENDFLYNIYIEDDEPSFNKALQDTVQFVDFNNNVALTFRIDNDDAVQANFIEKMREFAKCEYADKVINIPLIYIIKRIGYSQFLLEKNYYPSNSIGLAYVTSEDKYTTVLEAGRHHVLNEEYELILLPQDKYASLQTINGENAVNTINESKSISLDSDEITKTLAAVHLNNLNLLTLKIFDDKKTGHQSSYSKILKLFTPPILIKLAQRLGV